MKKITVGIIGTGRFAGTLDALFAREPDRWSVIHSSTSKPVDDKKIFLLSEVAKCQIIIPAVPISALEATLVRLDTCLAPEGVHPLVMSVCSVMGAPENWLRRHVRDKGADILVTHPVFGPQSTQQGTTFEGLSLVWNPVRIRNKARLESLKAFLQRQQLKLLSMTSEQHDQIIAHTQFVSFLFGQIGVELGLASTPLDTRGFTHILQNQAIVASDTQQLFLDIYRHNAHAGQQLQKIIRFVLQLRTTTQSVSDGQSLISLRERIDQLDEQLLSLLNQRLQVVKQVGQLKKAQGIPPLQLGRWQQVLSNLLKKAEGSSLSDQFVKDIWNRIHAEALYLEENV